MKSSHTQDMFSQTHDRQDPLNYICIEDTCPATFLQRRRSASSATAQHQLANMDHTNKAHVKHRQTLLGLDGDQAPTRSYAFLIRNLSQVAISWIPLAAAMREIWSAHRTLCSELSSEEEALLSVRIYTQIIDTMQTSDTAPVIPEILRSGKAVKSIRWNRY